MTEFTRVGDAILASRDGDEHMLSLEDARAAHAEAVEVQTKLGRALGLAPASPQPLEAAGEYHARVQAAMGNTPTLPAYAEVRMTPALDPYAV